MKVRNAGTSERYGASWKTNRSALVGMMSSFMKSLVPSASVWSRPQGPATFGPMRFCNRLTTLRSYQTMNMVATRQMANAATTMTITMMKSPRSTPSRRNGWPISLPSLECR